MEGAQKPAGPGLRGVEGWEQEEVEEELKQVLNPVCPGQGRAKRLGQGVQGAREPANATGTQPRVQRLPRSLLPPLSNPDAGGSNRNPR